MSLAKFTDRLCEVGIPASTEDGKVILKYADREISIEVGSEWKNELRIFFKAKQYTFHTESRTLQANQSVEFALRYLSRYFLFNRPDYVFNSQKSDKLVIRPASIRWKLGFLMSEEYVDYAESLKKRLERSNPHIRSLDNIIYSPVTARFSSQKRLDREGFLQYAQNRVESCLLKLAIERDECWDFSYMSIRSLRSRYDDSDSKQLDMPMAIYNKSLVKYYKVAKSSQFPSQAFLSYYHILEHQFYRISDQNLYTKVRGNVNNIKFNGSDEDIRHLLATIYKHKRDQDETALLKIVLDYFIDETEYIQYVLELEKELNEKKYSNLQDVFGEKLKITLKDGHAINNTAKVIKHIRNYLVHSSDKVTRDDRHVPLTGSADIVHVYLPIIEYLAEKVMFGCTNE